MVMSVGRIFHGRGAVGDFPKIFSRGDKSGEICFLPLEIKKITFFANNFKIQGGKDPLHPLPMPMCMVIGLFLWGSKNMHF